MTLASWLEQEGVSPASLATRLGVARQTVYCWISGEFGPSRKHLAELYKITNNQVTVLDFAVPSDDMVSVVTPIET